MMFPLVRDLAADRTWKVPVVVTCRVLGFSKQAYYAWRAAPVIDREWSDAHLINAAIDIHRDDPEFGYRFITDELVEHGVIAPARNRGHCRRHMPLGGGGIVHGVGRDHRHPSAPAIPISRSLWVLSSGLWWSISVLLTSA
jgi:hypothetical protein